MATSPTWVESLGEKLSARPEMLNEWSGKSTCSIHRVLRGFREGNEKSYTPQYVSVGPLHWGDPKLKLMDEHKWRLLNGILSRVGNDRLETYFMGVWALEQRARECYSETRIPGKKEFVEMLVVDGCFILELFCMEAKLLEVDTDEPIFKHRCLMAKLRIDFLLLENQIPFFVLQNLYDKMDFPGKTKPSLLSIAVKFFVNFVPSIKTTINENHSINNREPQHLLHLFRSNLLGKIKKKEQKDSLKPFPSATQLREEGISFKKSDSDSLLDIKFNRGVLKIPLLSFEGKTQSLLLNLIAYEQCYRHSADLIAAYAIFMDCLIDSAEDVRILRNEGIIDNWMGSDDEVANLFNKLGKEVVITKNYFYLSDVCEKINGYRNRRIHNLWGSFSLRYCNCKNPWIYIGLVGYIIIFTLTLLQVIKAFKPSPSP